MVGKVGPTVMHEKVLSRTRCGECPCRDVSQTRARASLASFCSISPYLAALSQDRSDIALRHVLICLGVSSRVDTHHFPGGGQPMILSPPQLVPLSAEEQQQQQLFSSLMSYLLGPTQQKPTSATTVRCLVPTSSDLR